MDEKSMRIKDEKIQYGNKEQEKNKQMPLKIKANDQRI